MRLYEDDIEAIQAVTTFLKGFREPEGFYLNLHVTNDTQEVVGKWEYEEGNWVFVTGDEQYTR